MTKATYFLLLLSCLQHAVAAFSGEECDADSECDTPVTLLQFNMTRKVGKPRIDMHHNMDLAPSGTLILDAYNQCSPHLSVPGFMEHSVIFEDPQTRTIWIPIYKNGETSVRSSLDRLQSITGPKGEAAPPVIKNAMSLGWFTMAVTRDPLERSVSAFHMDLKIATCVSPHGSCGDMDSWGDEAYEGEYPCQICQGEPPEEFSSANLVPMFREKLQQIAGATGSYEPPAPHMAPQIFFMMWSNGTKVSVDYIGSLDATDDGLDKEFKFAFDTDQPLRDDVNAAGYEETDWFRLDKDLLPNEVVLEVCRTYYHDYCCFGHDFPEVCQEAGLAC